MKTELSHQNSRGTSWVIVQFGLMMAFLAAGPAWRAQWHNDLSLLGGVLLAILGAGFGIAGKHALGNNRTPFPRPKDGSQLITTGVYALVRHPLYASMITLGFAWALLWRSWPALALALAQTIFFDAKARREERWLSGIFPSYPDYCAQVKRFIPGFY